MKSLETLGPFGAPFKAVSSYKDLIDAKIHDQKTDDLLTLLKEVESFTASKIQSLEHELGVSRKLLMIIVESVREVLKERKVVQAVSAEEFYRIGFEIVRNSKTTRFASKTPALLLPGERLTYWRRKYYTTLIRKIKEGKIKALYLFALPTTRQAILQIGKRNLAKASRILQEWRDLLKFRNLQLRYTTTTDFISSIIGENEVLIGWKSPKSKRIIGVTLLKDQSRFYLEIFDQFFSEASENNIAAIESIEVDLRKGEKQNLRKEVQQFK